jgi:hypothetical protein
VAKWGTPKKSFKVKIFFAGDQPDMFGPKVSKMICIQTHPVNMMHFAQLFQSQVRIFETLNTFQLILKQHSDILRRNNNIAVTTYIYE